jgi:DNA primase
MPSSTTELIKSKLDIADVLRGYITLIPAGKNFKARCPFHNEKTPSFIVSPDRQTWHCFGCGLGGDIFTFVMKHENMEFGEALRFLAEKAGVELRTQNPAEYRYTGLLYDLNEAAKRYFMKSLVAAPIAKKYLEERGLTAETIETFEIGWAPNEPEGLSMALLNGGASPQDLVQAGLSIKTERGLMLDRFRGRIMFPIHNHLGKVVGFTGRILPQLDTGTLGKYINSPETPIFQKSKLIYGFWKSKEGVRAEKSAFLVEGQMDFLMSWQAGIKNVIASSGTALTADHLRSIYRLAQELILSFDNDVAGSDAAERAIDLAEANDFTVKIATFGEGVKDAADAVKADPTSVARVIAAAVPAPEFYFKKYLPADMHDLQSREGLEKLRIILAKLRHIASPVERDFWMKELARRTGVNEQTLQEEAVKADTSFGGGGSSSSQFDRREGGQQEQEEAPKRQLSRYERLGEELLAMGLALGDFNFMEDCASYLLPTQKEVLSLLKTGARRSDDPALDTALNFIVLQIPEAADLDEAAMIKSELLKEYYKERRQILTLAVRNAEARGDEKELSAALNELRELSAMDTD